MLKNLHILDFAVIAELDIQFNQGMIVFTGETGAGKSILVGALGLVIGGRADNGMIRSRCERAEITAIFDPGNKGTIAALLSEQEITSGDELILRRVINQDGRSRAYVNGSSVPVQLLRILGEHLVDIHGQHAHQSLLKPEHQRALLDEFGGYQQQLKQVRDIWQQWHEITLELQALSHEAQGQSAQIALLQYQVQELAAMHLEEIKFSDLEAEYVRLANANHLLENCHQMMQQLTEDENAVLGQLHQTMSRLQDLQKFDRALSSIIELLNTASIQISEAGNELRDYSGRLEIDPGKLKAIENQLASLHEMARKHKIRPEELPGHMETLQAELQKIESGASRRETLVALQSASLEQYQQAAAELSRCRRQAAAILSRKISNKLPEVGLPNGCFTVDLKAMAASEPKQDGIDQINYLISLNPGQAMQPLGKIASGGELSRISLIIQVIGNKDKGTPTLIFDEVDSGIGGGIAEIVGKLLHSLAAKRQVFCVTHLAQIAAIGDHHLQVTKAVHAGTTLTRVTALNKQARIDEIARMLGGIKITKQTLVHAEEMLNG